MAYLTIPIKILRKFACKPSRAYAKDVADDLYACVFEGDDDPPLEPDTVAYKFSNPVPHIVIPPRGKALIPTGIAIGLPEGYKAEFRTRSSYARKGITVEGGVIDNGYIGELGVILYNHNTIPFTIHHGDKIAQMIVEEYHMVDYPVVEDLDGTERGNKGFGSSGK